MISISNQTWMVLIGVIGIISIPFVRRIIIGLPGQRKQKAQKRDRRAHTTSDYFKERRCAICSRFLPFGWCVPHPSEDGEWIALPQDRNLCMHCYHVHELGELEEVG